MNGKIVAAIACALLIADGGFYGADPMLLPRERVETRTEANSEVIERIGALESKHLWGNCVITHYCNCSACCGQWAGGGTASGTIPTAGRTVACGDLPFGTEIEINGERYIVEDRGVSGFWVDIFVNGHQDALDKGMYRADVYIIDRR